MRQITCKLFFQKNKRKIDKIRNLNKKKPEYEKWNEI